ncbi:MAG: uroporphyrinogen-III synthase [Gammaproteobacteria bacterium]|jgi:uroporphyrinogen-III synthase
MSESDRLAGLNVLVTRPAGQGDSLAAAIERAGGVPVLFPLLSIQPVEDAARVALIRHRIQDLDNYHILVFISTNAARFGLEWIDRYWPQFPTGIDVVAVGPSTAEALAALPCAIATSPAGMQSEDILQLPLLTDVKEKKIGLFRGVGGRELLADTLRERGAQVDYIETYLRSEPGVQGAELLEVLRDRNINAISVTSGQMLDTLCRLVDCRHVPVSLIPLVVPSERIQQAALAAGFEQVINSSGATDHAIVTALMEIAGGRSPRAGDADRLATERLDTERAVKEKHGKERHDSLRAAKDEAP